MGAPLGSAVLTSLPSRPTKVRQLPSTVVGLTEASIVHWAGAMVCKSVPVGKRLLRPGEGSWIVTAILNAPLVGTSTDCGGGNLFTIVVACPTFHPGVQRVAVPRAVVAGDVGWGNPWTWIDFDRRPTSGGLDGVTSRDHTEIWIRALSPNCQ